MLSFLPPDVSATIARKPARKAPKTKPAELTGAQVVLQLLPKLALQPTGLKLSLAEALGGSGSDLYLRSGVGQLYINTSGSTTWTLDGAVYPAAADGTAVNCPILRKTYSAGTANTDFAVPTRTGGWRITNVYIINGGAGSGAVQLQTSGGALNITDAMTSSASGNGFITRAASILNNTVASGATLRIAATSPASAGEMFITLEPA